MYFTRNQIILIFLIFGLVFLFSIMGYINGDSYFCDGYVEQAVLIEQKILNYNSDVSLVPYRPDENITIQRMKLFFKGNMSWVDKDFHWTEEKTYDLIENYETEINNNNIYSLNYKNPIYSPTRPIYPLLIAFTNLIFGNIFFSAILVNMLFVILCCYLIVLFAKEYNLSNQVAFVAILFFLTSSTTIRFFISGHNDYTALFVGMYAILMFEKYIKTKENKYIFWYVLFITIAIFTREIFILLSILVLFYSFFVDKKNIIFSIIISVISPLLYFLYLYLADIIYLFIEVRVIGTKVYLMLHPANATLSALCLAKLDVTNNSPLLAPV